MNIIKNEQLSLLYQVFGWKGQDRLSVAVLTAFSLQDNQTLYDEAELWDKAATAMGDQGVLDLCMPKPKSEVLVLGKCFAPKGKEVQRSEVYFSLGRIEKRVAVFGDRYFRGGLIKNESTDIKPFKEIDITWANAFGGPAYDKNPDGMGIEPVFTAKGDRLIPRPKIENPDKLTRSPDDKPEPAGFAPLGLNWPARLKNTGTFDQNWLLERWPGLPDDFDFEYFNIAPKDQRIEEVFKGDEQYLIKGTHPEFEKIEGRLPGLRCRLFIDRKVPNNDSFNEVKTRLDTVYLIPHLDMGLLIWHGTARVDDDEAADVGSIMAFCEPSSEEPKPAEFYKSQLEEKVEKSVLEKKAEAEKPSAAAAAATVDSASDMRAAEKPKPAAIRSPDQLTREDVLQMYADGRSFSGVNLSGLDLSECDLSGINLSGAIMENVRFNKSNLSRADLTGAVLTGSDLSGANLNSSTISDAVAFQAKFTAAELTDVDLSNSDFTLTDFTKAMLAGADVSGCNFSQAVLTGSEFSGVKAMQAEFEGANLSNTIWKQADLTGADMSDAVLDNADFTTVIAGDLKLYGAKGQGVKFSGSDLHGSRAGEETSLISCDFTQAGLADVCWSDADFSESDFSRSSLENSQMDRCRLTGTNFTTAAAVGANFSKSDLSKSKMATINLMGGSLRKAVLEEADLTGANLYGVDLFKAALRGAKLNEANLDNTLITALRSE